MALVLSSLIICTVLATCSRPRIKKLEAAPIDIIAAATDTIILERKVVVDLCVDEKGNVISAAFNPNQSTTADTSLIHKALRAVQKYKFEPQKDKPLQCGKLTFNFKLKQ